MGEPPQTTEHLNRDVEARYAARLEQEVARVREDSKKAIEKFKENFGPPNVTQIERLLYPELSEFVLNLGGRAFTLRELPALTEKRFLRLVEQKLPALLAELLSLDSRLGDDPAKTFAQLLARAGAAIDLVAEACVLVLDPGSEENVTAEFVQHNASTSRQLRILQAQVMLNGGRDFLLRLFPVLRPGVVEEMEPTHDNQDGLTANGKTIGPSPQRLAGSNISVIPPMPSHGDSPSANWP